MTPIWERTPPPQGTRIWAQGWEVEGLGSTLRVQDSGFRVQGLEFRVLRVGVEYKCFETLAIHELSSWKFTEQIDLS